MGIFDCGWRTVRASIQAHDCGPPVLTLKSGESCTWTITADLLETSTTYTPLSLTGPAGVALITPFAPFDAKHGVFTINGQTPGTTTFKVHWSYPGTGAAADCTVEIRVTQAGTNINDQSVVREGSLSTWDGKSIIRAKILRDAIDHHIPSEAKMMVIFTQCYGGSMAESSRFEVMPKHDRAFRHQRESNREVRRGMMMTRPWR